MPNYIAHKILNPDKNIFLCTSKSQEQYNSLKKLIKNSDKEIIESWDYNLIREQVNKIVEKFKSEDVVLNFTGGNKIMSTSAFNLFKDLRKNCIYINTEKNEYIYFDFISNEIKSFPIEIKFELEAVLVLNGQDFEFVEKNLDETYQKLINLLIELDDLQELSLKIAKRIGNQKSYNEPIKSRKFEGSEIIILNNNCKLKIVYNGKELYYYSGTDKRIIELFLGKWFEYACYKKLKELQYFDDIKMNCTIKRKVRSSDELNIDKNEIDIIANKGPYPYVFECKSGNIKSESVDKLVAIKESYIGRYTSLFFLSMHPLNNNNSSHKNVIEKIKDNKIIHFKFKDLDDKPKVTSFLNEKTNLK